MDSIVYTKLRYAQPVGKQWKQNTEKHSDEKFNCYGVVELNDTSILTFFLCFK